MRRNQIGRRRKKEREEKNGKGGENILNSAKAGPLPFFFFSLPHMFILSFLLSLKNHKNYTYNYCAYNFETWPQVIRRFSVFSTGKYDRNGTLLHIRCGPTTTHHIHTD